MHSRVRFLLCVFAIALGGAIVGIDIGIIATTLGQPSFNSFMFPPGTSNVSSLVGAIVSMGSTGNVVGSLILGFALEKFGRKKAVALATFFTIVGAIMQCAANGVAVMIAGRLFGGIAVGMLNGGLPVYISELALPRERARLVGIFGLMIAIGFCLANWIGYACSFAEGNLARRLELAMQCPLAVVMLVLAFFVPESPRWRKSPLILFYRLRTWLKHQQSSNKTKPISFTPRCVNSTATKTPSLSPAPSLRSVNRSTSREQAEETPKRAMP